LMPMEPDPGDDNSSAFTLVMVDPDAPSRKEPENGPFRHWVLSGLKPPTPGEIEVAASTEREILSSDPDPLSAQTSNVPISQYTPPQPPQGSGPHRYVFLLFSEKDGGYDVPENAVELDHNNRKRWDAMAFAKKYGLTLVGANFFIVEG